MHQPSRDCVSFQSSWIVFFGTPDAREHWSFRRMKRGLTIRNMIHYRGSQKLGLATSMTRTQYPHNFTVPFVPISSTSDNGRGAFDGNLLGNGEGTPSDVRVDHELPHLFAGHALRDIRQDLMKVLDFCFTPSLSNDTSIFLQASEFEVAHKGGQPDEGSSRRCGWQLLEVTEEDKVHWSEAVRAFAVLASITCPAQNFSDALKARLVLH